MASARTGRLALVLTGIIFLSACEEGQEFNLFGAANPQSTAPAATAGVAVEQDVEAPEVFQNADSGLWDGRPSLGGVWVAHPAVTAPERAMIRNEDNGKFIIGALFRRELENPGPKFQVSSDAAAELGMLAGSPSNLNVVALRRVAVPVVEEVQPILAEPEAIAVVTETIGSPETIEAKPADPIAAIAATAIEAATAENPAATLPAASTAAEAVIATPTAPSVAPAIVPAVTGAPLSALSKPFVQIGIFSIESNANDTATLLRSAGIIPTIKSSNSNGKNYWRVVVGPIGNSADRTAVIKKVKGLGFPDAYAVTN